MPLEIGLFHSLASAWLHDYDFDDDFGDFIDILMVILMILMMIFIMIVMLLIMMMPMRCFILWHPHVTTTAQYTGIGWF